MRLLSVVVHSGLRPWTAPGGATGISVADDGEVLMPLSCSYLSLDARRLAQDYLPSHNLVAVVFELDSVTLPADIAGPMRVLSDWLPEAVGSDMARTVLEAIFEWLRTTLPRMFSGADALAAVASSRRELQELEVTMTGLAQQAKIWEADWLRQGVEQGIEQGMQRGLAAERELLRGQVERKFDTATAEELARRLATVTDAERLAEVGGWIIDCDTGAELLDHMDAV